jgi:hypothetical protein
MLGALGATEGGVLQWAPLFFWGAVTGAISLPEISPDFRFLLFVRRAHPGSLHPAFSEDYWTA